MLYWFRFGGQYSWQSDQWGLLKGLGAAVLVASIVHRLVWIVLGRLDNYFNHPPPFFTSLSRTRAFDVMRSRLKTTYHVSENLSTAELSALSYEITADRSFSLMDANIFLGSPSDSGGGGYEWRGSTTERGIDQLEGPIGAVLRFLGNLTWWNSDFSVKVGIKARIVGLDDQCTYVELEFTNYASPEIINYWGTVERTVRLIELKKALQLRSAPYAQDHKENADEDGEEDDDDDQMPSTKSQDPPLTEEQFQSLWAEAGQGNAAAQLKVGNHLRDERDYAKAARCYRFAADQNNCQAQLQLALLMRHGLGIEENKEESFQLCLRAAQGGENVEAMYQVGYCLINRVGTFVDVDEAYQWFLKAAQLGHGQAAFLLADLLDRYDNMPRNDRLGSYYWYTEAAKRGCIEALWKLSSLCYQGRDRQTNHREAFRWFRKAALLGDPSSQAKLGEMYLYQLGVDQNLRLAKYWSEKADAQGLKEFSKTLQTARLEAWKYGHPDLCQWTRTL